MRHADANEMTTNSAAEHAGVDVETVRFYETSHGVVYDQRPLDFKFVPSANSNFTTDVNDLSARKPSGFRALFTSCACSERYLKERHAGD